MCSCICVDIGLVACSCICMCRSKCRCMCVCVYIQQEELPAELFQFHEFHAHMQEEEEGIVDEHRDLVEVSRCTMWAWLYLSAAPSVGALCGYGLYQCVASLQRFLLN